MSSALGWGTHALALLSFRAGSYFGVFTLLPPLSGQGHAHHGDIMREALQLAEAGKLKPRVDPRRYSLTSVGDAYRAIEDRSAAGKIVVDIAACAAIFSRARYTIIPQEGAMQSRYGR